VGEATSLTDVSPTTCTKCKKFPIATATTKVVADVTQSVSIISIGDALSTVSASMGCTVVEVHRT
jgi:hypothetical protein